MVRREQTGELAGSVPSRYSLTPSHQLETQEDLSLMLRAPTWAKSPWFVETVQLLCSQECPPPHPSPTWQQERRRFIILSLQGQHMTGIHLNTVQSAEAKSAKSRAGAAENCFNRKTGWATVPRCLTYTQSRTVGLYYLACRGR